MYVVFVVFGFVPIVMLIGLPVVAALCCFILFFSWGRLIVVVFNNDVEVWS